MSNQNETFSVNTYLLLNYKWTPSKSFVWETTQQPRYFNSAQQCGNLETGMALSSLVTAIFMFYNMPKRCLWDGFSMLRRNTQTQLRQIQGLRNNRDAFPYQKLCNQKCHVTRRTVVSSYLWYLVSWVNCLLESITLALSHFQKKMWKLIIMISSLSRNFLDFQTSLYISRIQFLKCSSPTPLSYLLY